MHVQIASAEPQARLKDGEVTLNALQVARLQFHRRMLALLDEPASAALDTCAPGIGG
jgi:hypothetical protein